MCAFNFVAAVLCMLTMSIKKQFTRCIHIFFAQNTKLITDGWKLPILCKSHVHRMWFIAISSWFEDQGFLSEGVWTWIVSSFNTCLRLHPHPHSLHAPCHFRSISVALFLDKHVQTREERNSSPHGKSEAYHWNWILACVLQPMGMCWYGLALDHGG